MTDPIRASVKPDAAKKTLDNIQHNPDLSLGWFSELPLHCCPARVTHDRRTGVPDRVFRVGFSQVVTARC